MFPSFNDGANFRDFMTRAVNFVRSGRTGEEDGREAALLDRVVRVELEPERVAF